MIKLEPNNSLISKVGQISNWFIIPTNNCAFLCQHLYDTSFAQIFCSGAEYFHYIRYKFSIITATKTAPSYGAIWDKFSDQQQHQSIKKAPFLMPYYYFFGVKKVQFHANFGWDWKYDHCYVCCIFIKGSTLIILVSLIYI